jgi:DinB family protein
MAAPQPVLVLPETRPAEVLAARYSHVRRVSLEICEPLQTEDFVVQSMPDASPTKWHLAHTSWFFEQFLLKPQLPGYRAFHPDFEYLFNSYYQSVGRMHERPQRGLLTRPTVDEVLRYREPGHESRAAAPGADAHGYQAPVLAQSAAARLSAGRRRIE